ncbi:MAG: hypothetical protein NVSMB22_25530 [Chloroflexota bacterium]
MAARWPAALAVLCGIVLFFLLPERLKINLGPRLLVPALELVLLIPLAATNLREEWHAKTWPRPLAIVLIAILNVANLVTLGQLVHLLIAGGHATGKELLVAGANVWLTNVIVFGLWYWELDRGGPVQRCSAHHREPDFLFPQMSSPKASAGPWSPSFVDYLYVSFTNATAFSPTDTMPLTEWAKILMMIQSAASLLTVGLVLARSVNILG